MNHSSCWWMFAGLAAVGPLTAGETLVVDGYAQQQPTDGSFLLSLSPIRGTVITVPAAPADRPFTPPGDVRWEIEITGVAPSGLRTGTALHTAPADFEWPAGEEIAPGRYQGSLGGMFPSSN